MGNKSTNKHNSNNSLRLSPHVHMGGIQKKVHEAKTSRVGRKARDIVRKNLYFFSRGVNPLLKQNSTNDFVLTSYPTYSSHKLPSNDEEDAPYHQAVFDSLSQDYALHASPSWQYITGTAHETSRFPPVEGLPRNWKQSLKSNELELYKFDQKQIKYQELIYEIILTEQTYVDDLILVYKIFIKETLVWDGLPAAVKCLFENVLQITRLHLQLLKELRARQMAQHPAVVSITDICRSFIPRFNIYASYFSNFEKASNIINDSIKQKDELGSFISRRSLWTECRNLPLSAYLLTPIQRVMKYPLFFKSLAECLQPTIENNLLLLNDINLFLEEMDVTLRYFEKQKKESEDYLKLEDLASRIKGLEGSTIRIAEPGRKLIYEGYLNIIPTTDNNSFHSSSRLDDSFLSFSTSNSSVYHPPTLSRKNSTFSLSGGKKSQKTYVFLFNDMIVCTRERYKKRSSPIDNNNKSIMGPPNIKGSFYGPSPDTLFKITHTPGKITLVDRTVTREIPDNNNNNNNNNTPSRRGSALFQSFRRYGSKNDDHNSIPPSPSSEFSQQHISSSYFTSQNCDIYNNNKLNTSITLERHPLQFICSIATKNLVNIRFETDTPEEKDIWCHHMESVLEEHVQRNTKQQQQNNKRASLSPTHSTFSIESTSSIESLPFATSWTGYCDVERMEVDGLDDEFSIGISPINTNTSELDKSQELLKTIMGEFDDSIWQVGNPPGLSPCQLRKTFSNV